ncbi:hypothetical protein HZH66_008994 [Vespula vulgaris]|uniref:SRA1/Sec31 domain-containing protein n=1 Tax=Vespula vulgaris TaxID=7454 RepID=A0A834JT81_VESVU|nr:uncharacterized protein LOC127067296 [Vespula vulgaris]KAF7393161.1 hypothetical protein HZH66_008994 [Vespula vulgaris]
MDEKSSDNAISTQKSLPSSYDPGWNDTPKWASPHAGNTNTPTKRILNKRVPFPLISGELTRNNTECQSNTAGMPLSPPPPPLPSPLSLKTAPHAPLITPSDANTQLTCTVTKFDKQQALVDTMANLEFIIKKYVMENKIDEVQKRLDLMKSCWLDNKLNDSIQQKIFDISKALKDEDVEKADKLHIALMIDHTSLCSAWIPSIRHIISALKEKKLRSDDI